LIYIFDTSALRVLHNFYPPTFPSLWQNLGSLVQLGVVQSVDEVYNELENFREDDHLLKWAKANKKIFAKPSNDELLIIKQIFAIASFRPLVPKGYS
jgi:hypothetical protein